MDKLGRAINAAAQGVRRPDNPVRVEKKTLCRVEIRGSRRWRYQYSTLCERPRCKRLAGKPHRAVRCQAERRCIAGADLGVLESATAFAEKGDRISSCHPKSSHSVKQDPMRAVSGIVPTRGHILPPPVGEPPQSLERRDPQCAVVLLRKRGDPASRYAIPLSKIGEHTILQMAHPTGVIADP